MMIPRADGYIAYLTLLNERDGGINGVPLVWGECETVHDVERGVECYERLQAKGPTGAAAMVMRGRPMTDALTERATHDHIPLLTPGFGRSDAADGRVFPYVFNLPINFLSQHTVKLRFLGQRVGGMAQLKGVAYASLLTARRQALHAATGAALERLYAVRLRDVYDRLAHHYARAQDASKAVTYLTLFAEHVARRYAHVEAVTALQEALTHVTQLPDAERERRTLELVLQLAHSFHFLGRFQEMLEILAQQQERLEQLHEPILTGPYAFWRSHALSYLGEYAQSVHWAQRAIEMAQQCGDEATMGKAYYVLVRNSFWTCQFPQGIEYGHRAVTLLERAGELWWLGQTHWAVGINYTFMGELMSAWEPIARTQAIGDLLGDPRLQCYAAWSKGYTATFARRLGDGGRRVSGESGALT